MKKYIKEELETIKANAKIAFKQGQESLGFTLHNAAHFAAFCDNVAQQLKIINCCQIVCFLIERRSENAK